MTPPDGGRLCRPHVVDAGFPNRGPLILGRERGLYPLMVTKLTTGGRGEPQRDMEGISMEVLEAAFDQRDGTRLPAAGFLAGRSEPEASEDQAQLTRLLGGVLSFLDPGQLSSWGPSYVEAAMSTALRGEAEGGRQALAAVIEGREPAATADWQAAYYLAQLGDPSGYPLLVECLQGPDGFTRLMAARHLAGFLPFDGQEVDGRVVDIRARLVDLADDKDELVAQEIPALLVDANVADLRAALGEVVEKARHKATKKAAKAELDEL